jgi:molybdopterin molybdotransferase
VSVRPQSAARAVSVEDAQAAVLSVIRRMPVERVPLDDAAGRVLAEPVAAAEDLWPFPRAAMDGVAARAGDLAEARAEELARLRVVGAIYSGEVWPVPLEPGTALRIATGSPIPSGADVVVPQELLRAAGDHVEVLAPVPHGRHIFPAGEDARAGETVLVPGVVLTGGHLSLLAAIGCAAVPVTTRPLAAILATGDELVAPAAPRAPGRVRDSNSYALAAEVLAAGARFRRLDPVGDDLGALSAAIAAGLDADLLIVTGGASVGERDRVGEALRRTGATFVVGGLAMKPGGPAAFGLARGRPVFVLPGTPGAARVAFEMLARPALCAMLGRADVQRPVVRGRLSAGLRVAAGRRRFLWAAVAITPEGIIAAPLPGQGTATLRSAADANALIDVAADAGPLDAGDEVRLHLLVEGLRVGPTAGRRVYCVVGARDAGKTTLIERLVPALRARGLVVVAVKHHVHLDTPERAGSDTARFAAAGAAATLLAGPGGIVRRLPSPVDPPIDEVLAMAGRADVVLVEGYSRSSQPKILVGRAGVAPARPAPAGPIVAVVDDAPHDAFAVAEGAAPFRWDQVDGLAALIASGPR